MTEVWELEGYAVEELIGYGATGEVWRAVEVASGDVVALKRLRSDADPAAVDALRREVVVLRTLDTPYVVRLRDVIGEGAETVLVLDHADGGSLGALLARRGRLDPGEVVTVAGPLAQALAVAHAAGLVHGDVTPANVLFSADGMPLLSDLGVARVAGDGRAVDGTAEYVDPVVAAGGLPDAAADVWALAAVCHHMLAGTPPHDGSSVGEVLQAAVAGARAPLGLLAPTAPRALVSAVEQALAAEPSARPDAAEFAKRVRRSHAAAPVRLLGPVAASPGQDARETHAVHAGEVPAEAEDARPWWLPVRPSRGLLLGAAAVVLVTVAATVGWLSGRGAPGGVAIASAPPLPSTAAVSPEQPSSSAASAAQRAAVPSPAQPSPSASAVADWADVLDRLDAVRAAAFAAADPVRLHAVYAADAPDMAADAAAIAQLRAERRTARGVRHEVLSVVPSSYSGRAVRLTVVDVLAGYELIGHDGSVVARAAPRAETTYSVELVMTSAGWRLRQVRPA